jgi:hypothetical protein
MDSTSLVMGLVFLVIIAIPVILLARAGRNKNDGNNEVK